MLAANIMSTDVPFLNAESTLLDAVKTLRGEDCPIVPVVDKEHRVVGVISRAGFLKAVFHGSMTGQNPAALKEFFLSIDAALVKRAADYIERDFLSAPPESTGDELAKIFLNTPGLDSIIVVDNRGRFLGVVTRRGFIERLSEYSEEKR